MFEYLFQEDLADLIEEQKNWKNRGKELKKLIKDIKKKIKQQQKQMK